MAELRIDPFYIDINLVSTVDLQANVSDYVTLLETFIDECALNNCYWHTDSHSDPITSKVNFYKNVNSGTFTLSGNQHGTTKSKTTPEQLQNKNYRDQVPDNAIIKTSSGNKYDKPQLKGETEIAATISTTKRVWKTDSDAETLANGYWENETTTKDVSYPVSPLLEAQKNPVSVQQEFGMKDMSPWFILWWMEKFYTAHDNVKSDLRSVLGDDNEYFVNFSESVGQLKNIKDTYDTSTLPVWDINVNAFGEEYSTPTLTAGIAKYCMQPESLALAEQLSNKTNTIFRRNISMLMEDPSKDELITGIMPTFSNQPHGNNLVNDFLHPVRITNFMETIQTVIQEHLKGLYDVLDLLSDRENYMVVNKPKQILMKVEKFTTSVDLFKNKIKSFDLPVNAGVITTYGRSSRFNTSSTTDARLSVGS